MKAPAPGEPQRYILFMNKKIIKAILGLLIIALFFIGLKAYFHLKAEGAIEAANVFVSPSHQKMFGAHFTPYPIDQGHRCLALQSKLHRSRNLKLKDIDWGAYVFQSEGPDGTLLYLALYEDFDGKWGVECWEQ